VASRSSVFTVVNTNEEGDSVQMAYCDLTSRYGDPLGKKNYLHLTMGIGSSILQKSFEPRVCDTLFKPHVGYFCLNCSLHHDVVVLVRSTSEAAPRCKEA
jgi:hypothetical protein